MTDLRENGFSVQRTALFGLQDAAEEIRKRNEASSGDIECDGLASARCRHIAGIVHEGEPAFDVNADGHLPDRHDAHVSIKFMSKLAKSIEKKLRKSLRDIFSDRQKVESLET
jgi:hypothetical protein